MLNVNDIYFFFYDLFVLIYYIEEKIYIWFLSVFVLIKFLNIKILLILFKIIFMF